MTTHTDVTQDANIIGNPALIVDTGRYSRFVITMDLMKVDPTVTWLSREFLYYLFRSPDFKWHCIGSSNGITVLHLSRKAIPNYEFSIPSRRKIEEFTDTVQPMVQQQHSNIYQIRTLERLRDTLLPKLMSGEVRVRL